MRMAFKKANVNVVDGLPTPAMEAKMKKEGVVPPIISFDDQMICERDDKGELVSFQAGEENITSPNGKVHLGAWMIPELYGKFYSNEELATSIAFVAIHEAGHSYNLLKHTFEKNNYMREQICFPGQGTGPGGKKTINDVVNAWLFPSSFTNEQLSTIESVAEIGR